MLPTSSAAVEIAAILVTLCCAMAFATLRIALQRSHPTRVLARVQSDRRRAVLAPLLARAESLATSASIGEVSCEVALALLVLRYVGGDAGFGLGSILTTLCISVPTILILSEALPSAIALWRGDALLVRVLPAFRLVQLPVEWLVRALEMTRRVAMRVLGLDKNPASTRHIVEGLREVIEETRISGDLDDTEREIIGNVIEVRDVSVSAVMTPRTELCAVELGDGLLAAARKTAQCGHSRIPVYEGSLDRIVGVITARDVVQVAAEQGLDRASLRSILRPAYFVPETKRVSALLSEFRREKIKLAIVLDEYGGTAGLVTLGDIITEIVGDIRDEFDREGPQPIRRLADGAAEVDASMHVSSVNEELGIDVPEGEDYETLAGFVLSELGHFPKRGEKLAVGGLEFTVLEASDRRVHKVCVKRVRQEAALPS